MVGGGDILLTPRSSSQKLTPYMQPIRVLEADHHHRREHPDNRDGLCHPRHRRHRTRSDERTDRRHRSCAPAKDRCAQSARHAWVQDISSTKYIDSDINIIISVPVVQIDGSITAQLSAVTSADVNVTFVTPSIYNSFAAPIVASQVCQPRSLPRGHCCDDTQKRAGDKRHYSAVASVLSQS